MTVPAGTDATVTTASPAATPLAASPVASATPAFSDARVTLGNVVWATAVDPASNAPVAPVSVFTVEDRVLYAAIPVARVAAGTRLRGAWEYNNTSLDGFSQEIIASADESDVWLEFHLALSGAASWPNGTYALTVSVDGTPALVSQVDVLDPGG